MGRTIYKEIKLDGDNRLEIAAKSDIDWCDLCDRAQANEKMLLIALDADEADRYWICKRCLQEIIKCME